VKDFDKDRVDRTQRDRTFKIGGETFTYRSSVAPEAIQGWTTFTSMTERAEAHMNAARAKLAALDATALVPERAKTLAEDPAQEAAHQQERASLTGEIAVRADELGDAQKDSDVINLIDETIRAMIVPADHDKWAKVRGSDAEEPVSIADLQAVLEWLIESVVNRPTGRPSGSSEQLSSNGTQSTGDSSSPVEPAPTPST
jgi:hypothetical protein